MEGGVERVGVFKEIFYKNIQNNLRSAEDQPMVVFEVLSLMSTFGEFFICYLNSY